MKKAIYLFLLISVVQGTFALDTVFDSMQNATEVKIQPTARAAAAATTNAVNTTPAKAPETKTLSIKDEKLNNSLINLDDAQVVLKQERANWSAKYNTALSEKQKAAAECKAYKKEVRAADRKIKKIEKSKKMINQTFDSVK